MTFQFSNLFSVWMVSEIWSQPAGIRNIEHTPVAVFVALPFREDIILYSLVVHIILLRLQIFHTENYILFKISSSGKVLNYS